MLPKENKIFFFEEPQNDAFLRPRSVEIKSKTKTPLEVTKSDPKNMTWVLFFGSDFEPVLLTPQIILQEKEGRKRSVQITPIYNGKKRQENDASFSKVRS